MFISRVKITNFRNFAYFDISLDKNAVIVGENKVGKSNFLYALRLLLDPSVPDSARQLRVEDFWEGISKPLESRAVIEVVVEFRGFEDDDKLLSILQDCLTTVDPAPVARWTYQFRPRATISSSKELGIEGYEYVIFGGIDEKNPITYRQRQWLPMELLPALRDAEGDLQSWRRSPLRPLLDRIQIPGTALSDVGAKVDEATRSLLKCPELGTINNAISSRITEMVGALLGVGAGLGFASTDPSKLLRDLRLFTGAQLQHTIGEESLGINNVLYLALLLLELDAKEKAGERAATIVAIEEPEAHLHPHVQRLIFRHFLRQYSTLLLTTHSPHIASVAPLNSLVLLRVTSAGTVASNTVSAGFSQQAISDLERYLDATRGEILFAKGVILVEGLAELYIVPAFAQLLGHALDSYGISVCSVHGTDFLPFARLLSEKALCVPFVVVTDGDPAPGADGSMVYRGLVRGAQLLEGLDKHGKKVGELAQRREWNTLRSLLRQNDTFVGDSTLEVALLDVGYGEAFVEVLADLGASKALQDRARKAIDQGPSFEPSAVSPMVSAVDRYGKGRFAQRLAARLTAACVPDYLAGAIQRIVEMVKP